MHVRQMLSQENSLDRSCIVMANASQVEPDVGQIRRVSHLLQFFDSDQDNTVVHLDSDRTTVSGHAVAIAPGSARRLQHRVLVGEWRSKRS